MAISGKEHQRRDDDSRRGILHISFPVQLVVLVVLLIVAWSLLGLISEAVFVLITATLIALVLNPLVKQVQRTHLPRLLATLVVIVGFILALAGMILLLVLPLIDQIADLRQTLPTLLEGADDRVADLQRFLDRVGVGIEVRTTIDSALSNAGSAIPSAGALAGYGVSIARSIALAVIILVTAIYMLADSARIYRFVVRRFPTGSPKDGEDYVRVAQSAVVRYVKAQLFVSLAVGSLVGATLYVLGLVGVFPLGARYALIFGVLAGILELIPFVGPVLAAIPPIFVAFISDPLSAVWVLLAFIAIQQLEGNVIGPLLMGTTLRVHPIVVIFATLVGAELRGLMGIILAVALLPLIRETIAFFRDRIELEGPWLARREAVDTPSPPAPRPPAAPIPQEDDSAAAGKPVKGDEAA